MLPQTRIGALLHTDHLATIETLQAVDEMLEKHRKAKNPPAIEGEVKELLQRLSKTMRAEVEKHFGFEENHLFTVFLNHGETGMVNILLQEHKTILPLALSLADKADKALEGGFSDVSWAEFRSQGGELVERELFHIQKEEMGMLAAISYLVTPDWDANLAETYEQTVR